MGWGYSFGFDRFYRCCIYDMGDIGLHGLYIYMFR